MEYLHKRLKEELDKLQKTLKWVAKEIGEKDSQGLRDVCAGRKRVTAELVAKLIPLGVDAMYVLTGIRSASTPTPPEPEVKPVTKAYASPKVALKVAEDTGVYDITSQPLNKREQALLANYRESDEEGKRTVESTARAFSRHDQKDGTSGK